MSVIEPDGIGKRIRGKVDDNNCYHICTVGSDGWIHFMCKVADENKPQNLKQRVLADELCKSHTQLINMILGNIGIPKEARGASAQQLNETMRGTLDEME